ncbi:MAG TPA: hypothetical protein PK971_00675 [Saprospiraceae bacterium]|nr:hypothetical protein [Saprospiraceae bacterium]
MQLLEPEEVETLHLFVASPIFHDRHHFEDTRKLFEFLKLHYPAFDRPELAKAAAGALLFGGRKDPEFDVTRAMAQVMHIVRQFINFRYSAVRGGQTARRSDKKELADNPILLLNFARQQLAMMRFYNERLHQREQPSAPSQEPAAADKGRRRRRPENFFHNLYAELSEVMTQPQDFSRYEEYEFGDYHYYRFLLEQEKALFDGASEHFEGDDNLMLASEALDRFYFINKLDLMSRLIHRHQIGRPFEEGALDARHYQENLAVVLDIVRLIQERGYTLTPGIRLYCSLLSFQTQQDPLLADEEAMRFNESLDRLICELPDNRREDFKTLLRSYWSRRYAHTKSHDLLERLHRLHIDQVGHIRQKKQGMPNSYCRNIVQTALKLGHYSWVEQLLNEFDGKITRTEHPDMAADIYRALLRFAEGRRSEARKCLPHYFTYGELDDLYLFAMAAATDVKLHYEADTLEDDEGHNMFRATQTRIDRAVKTLPASRREERLHFYRMVRKLLSIRRKLASNPKADLSKLLDEAQAMLQSSPVVEKEWLSQKLAELKAK